MLQIKPMTIKKFSQYRTSAIELGAWNIYHLFQLGLLLTRFRIFGLQNSNEQLRMDALNRLVSIKSETLIVHENHEA